MATHTWLVYSRAGLQHVSEMLIIFVKYSNGGSVLPRIISIVYAGLSYGPDDELKCYGAPLLYRGQYRSNITWS